MNAPESAPPTMTAIESVAIIAIFLAVIMANPFTIRDARPDELDAIHDLTRRAYAEYATLMEPPAWALLDQALESALASEHSAERIVADDRGTLIGSVMLYAPAASA